jgi:eukaryotic-like serine/threonine-protein kinase
MPMAERSRVRECRPDSVSAEDVRVADRYRLLTLLGAGSSGAVWLAHDDLLDRRVALKRINRAGPIGRPIDEARAAAAVPHLNTVRVHDLIRDDAAGVAWMVMEALSGRSVADVVRREAGLGVGETRHVARSVLAALSAMHRAGMVHRDVKPANIQLCADGRVVLLDFGLAGRPAQADPALVVGSLPYLAPEVLQGRPHSPASDLYALGMTLYAALSGDLPVMPTYHLDTGSWAIPRIDPLPPMAAPLEVVVRGLLHRSPRDRLTAEQTDRLLDRG